MKRTKLARDLREAVGAVVATRQEWKTKDTYAEFLRRNKRWARRIERFAAEGEGLDVLIQSQLMRLLSGVHNKLVDQNGRRAIVALHAGEGQGFVWRRFVDCTTAHRDRIIQPRMDLSDGVNAGIDYVTFSFSILAEHAEGTKIGEIEDVIEERWQAQAPDLKIAV